MSTTKHSLPIQNEKYAIHLSPIQVVLVCVFLIVFMPVILAGILITEMTALIVLFFVDEDKLVKRISGDGIEWHG